jgi:hypothetical protein
MTKRRETSVDTAAKFWALRRTRGHRKCRPRGIGRLVCCPRFAWGDGHHDRDCRLFDESREAMTDTWMDWWEIALVTTILLVATLLMYLEDCRREK